MQPCNFQRWALILASYNYSIEYHPTGVHADADMMSRLSTTQTWSPKSEIIKCFLDTAVVTTVTCQMIKKETQIDPVLFQLYKYVISGWPHLVGPSLLPFKTRHDELSTQQDCILWAGYVIVPLFCMNYTTLTQECLK